MLLKQQDFLFSPIFRSANKHQFIFLSGLAICLIALPFSRALLSISLIILTLNWLWEGNMRSKFNQISSSPLAQILIAFFFIHLFGLFYSEDISSGWADLQVKLPLLLFPLILSSSPRLSGGQFQFLIWSYIFSCLIAVILCLTLAFSHFLINGHGLMEIIGARELNYELLSAHMNLHPTYFALLINLAMISLIWIWYRNKNVGNFRFHACMLGLLLFFLTFLMLLSAKMQILAFIILMGGGLIYRAMKGARWKSSLVFLSCMIFFMAGLVALNPQNQSRIESIIQTENTDPEKINSRDIRLQIWSAVAEVFSQHSWIGVGIGDKNDVLTSTYADQDFVYGVESEFNAHSQYGETLVGLGVIGLMTLLLALGFSARQALRQKNTLYFAFLVLLALSFLTESLLTRQIGVFSYAMLNSLLAFQSPGEV